VSAVAVVVETDADDPAVAETVAAEGPLGVSADGGEAEAGVELPDEHAPAPDELVSEDLAEAAESALGDGTGEDDILMVSRKGQAVRFHEDALRPMGRDTTGVRGMDVSGPDDEVLAMDVASEDQELLDVTENGYGKRTPIDQYRKTNRGTKGVGTIRLTETKGALAGALVVREHYDLVFISTNGMVQRTGVRGISQYGRLSQGVRVMNMKPEDTVSAVAVVVETDPDDPAVAETVAAEGPLEVSADGGQGEAGVELPAEHAQDPSELVSEDLAEAAESALGDGSGEDEPSEVDLDDTDGPPTPDA
jgi:DNA gyrase subunit A